MIAQYHVVEDFDGGVHAERALLHVIVDHPLLRRQIAGLYENFLELKQVQLNVLTLLQEVVLVVSFLNASILAANIPNCSLHFLLHVFNFFCSLDQLHGRLENLLEFV